MGLDGFYQRRGCKIVQENFSFFSANCYLEWLEIPVNNKVVGLNRNTDMSISRQKGTTYCISAINGPYTSCSFHIPYFEGAYEALSDIIKTIDECLSSPFEADARI
jgi:hypothetical protein